MKTLREVKKQIAQNERAAYQKGISDAQYKKIARETENLRIAQKYLETEPSENYLKTELDRLSRVVKAKMDQYDYWFSNVKPFDVEPKDAPAYFNRENGLAHLRKQIKFLQFILE